ncbi:NAD(P)H-dependent oxidoreductase [Chryseobacterium sp. MYb264]|uniref:FMN-dependent NADH-azoreductase n=1 Tax=Chryseobacterium sp. MYb264 TaxID=2745153 RepID=UPI002E16886B|nr:NAD(P)H-dependent oxidoreductase [Chryseobacterium sp. MYb264]
MSKKVLYIISSTRGNESFTNILGNAVIEKIRENDDDIIVEILDLSNENFPHLTQEHINSFFTPPEHRTPELNQIIKKSDEAVVQIQDADYIVIGVPMYNFGITSSLKAYFDHIARAKVTFRYTENGSEGLLNNKKAFIAASTAGVFSSGINQSYDFAIPYVKHFLSFIGITDVTVFRAEGTAIPGLQELALNKAINEISEYQYAGAIL